MGCCFSSSSSLITTSAPPPTAVVIALDGSLTEHSVPVTVSEVLSIDHLTCFLCNSDTLSFDACPLPLRHSDCLEQDQIYFVLPKSKLGCLLTGADMAALAAKASSAMALASRRSGTKRRKISAEPVEGGVATTINRPVKIGSSSSSPTSWVKVLRRSLRRTLSMIEEADERLQVEGEERLGS